MTEPLAVIEKDGMLECTIDSLTTRQESSVTLCKGVEWIFRLIPTVADAANGVKGLRHFSIEIGSNENYKSKTWFLCPNYSIELYLSADMTVAPICIWNGAFSMKSVDPTVRVVFFRKGIVVQARCDAEIELEDIDFDEVTHCRCRVTNIRPKGIPVRRLSSARLNPRDSQSPYDRILVVEDVKFYVQSQVLSMWSGYFDKLFHSEFSEKQSEEIELKDVSADSFEQLLRLIYPQSQPPTCDTVKSLLCLADRFDMPDAMEKCRQFLYEDAGKTVNLFKLMQLAKEYSFADLQEVALSKLLEIPSLGKYVQANIKDYDALDNLGLRDIVYALILSEAPKTGK